MWNLSKTILDGVLLSVIASCILIVSLYINPRTFLQDYPEDIQAKVHPKTPSEKRLSLLTGIPFLLVLILVPFFSTLTLKHQNGGSSPFIALFFNAFGVAFIFNLVDLLVLDWLLFCTITPEFLIIPGTEGMKSYRDYGFHFRGFIIGTLLSAIGAFVIAGIVVLIG
jgi:hypothetical protein